MASPPELTVIALSNRLRAESWGFVDHAIAQHADVVGFDLDDVAGFQIARRIEPRAGAGRRSRDDDIAGHQRREGRDIVDQIAKAEDQPAGAVVLPGLAVDPRGQPDIGDLRFIGVGNEPRAEAAGGIEILALRDIEFGVPDPVADGAFIAQRDRGDVIERRAFGDVPAGLADDENQFAFVIELRARRAGEPAACRWPTNERGVRMNMLGYFGASWPSLYSALRSG